MINLLIKVFVCLCFLQIANSCREEIITPDNFVDRINDPVQVREFNSYIFILNAENFSMNLNIPSLFSSLRTRFSIKLVDYKSGYASISAQDYNSIERFRYFIADEIAYDTELLDGFVPENIKIRTENLSGKIKIEFRKTL